MREVQIRKITEGPGKGRVEAVISGGTGLTCYSPGFGFIGCHQEWVDACTERASEKETREMRQALIQRRFSEGDGDGEFRIASGRP